MRNVTFIEKLSPYNPGERAGFPDAVAQRMVDSGVARWTEEETAGDPTGGTNAPPDSTKADPPAGGTGSPDAPPPELPADLGGWSKQQIADWAQEHLSLTLDPAGKRDDMVEAVRAEHAKRTAAAAAAGGEGAGGAQ